MTQRTPVQNAALHMLFERLADALNDAGYDMKKVLEIKEVDVPWNKEMVKEVLWKGIQATMYPETVSENGTVSTTKLTTGQVSKVYDVLDRHLSSKLSIHVEFPSEESLIDEQRGKYGK